LQSFFAEGEHGAWWASHLHNAIAIRRKKWWEKPNEEETHIYSQISTEKGVPAIFGVTQEDSRFYRDIG
jgi:hypothetical protein